MGWAGFNGGDPYTANIDSSWLDVIFFEKPSVIGAVHGMITGLVCITPGPALGQKFLIKQAALPETTEFYDNGGVEIAMATQLYPMASMVFMIMVVLAAITLILLAGSVVGRMNFEAWMSFVPLWLTFSYTVGAFRLWGIMVYSGGYVIHLVVIFPWREERIFLQVDGEKFLKMMQGQDCYGWDGLDSMVEIHTLPTLTLPWPYLTQTFAQLLLLYMST
ncbi:AMMONIUM TRANSPORTER [Salix koriyanagi]|uniref:AMMONIUM TRANSPORTER n=1 Tax=Salix koriyanagi TaxID=2511006 RepID=A0A9Q1A7Q4_9ROSI|nr:AMMONIUM TRANSPORTER [Salix koriyanagi]